jgi:PAS domain-containing protein
MSPPPADATTRRRARVLRALTLLLAAAIFAVDLRIPLGVADAVPYVAVVLVTLAFAGRRECVLWALGCSALTLAGYALSPNPEGTELWKAVANRAVALLAIWVTVGVGVGWQRARAEAEAGRRRLAAIIDSALDAVVGVDAAQRIVLFNRAAETISARGARRGRAAAEILIPARFRARTRRRSASARRASPRRRMSRGSWWAARRRRGVPDRGLDLARRSGRRAASHGDSA